MALDPLLSVDAPIVDLCLINHLSVTLCYIPCRRICTRRIYSIPNLTSTPTPWSLSSYYRILLFHFHFLLLLLLLPQAALREPCMLCSALFPIVNPASGSSSFRQVIKKYKLEVGGKKQSRRFNTPQGHSSQSPLLFSRPPARLRARTNKPVRVLYTQHCNAKGRPPTVGGALRTTTSKQPAAWARPLSASFVP